MMIRFLSLRGLLICASLFCCGRLRVRLVFFGICWLGMLVLLICLVVVWLIFILLWLLVIEFGL